LLASFILAFAFSFNVPPLAKAANPISAITNSSVNASRIASAGNLFFLIGLLPSILICSPYGLDNIGHITLMRKAMK